VYKFILTIICLLLAIPCQARTITVANYGFPNFNNIQAAIDDANDGDIIEVRPGTYTGTGNRDIDFKGKAITVKSEYGPEDCIIYCQGSQTQSHRGFYFQSGESLNSVLDGFTITNGYTLNGSGICCRNSSPKITNCIIIGNIARSSQPNAGFGGGIYCSNSGAVLVNCVISNNSAEGDGGGMANNNNGNPNLINCTFNANSISGKSGDGGGVHNSSSSPTFTSCRFSNNKATNSGGGMCNDSSSNVTLTNCIFSKNWAFFDGAGMCTSAYSRVTVTNCTFSDNWVTYGPGAGSYSDRYNNVLTFINCILWNNSDSYGSNESAQLLSDGGTLTVNYSCIQGLTGGLGGTGNIGVNPSLASDGYHLQSNSPCINAGDPAGDYMGQTDIDGQLRVVWGRIDMGADEFYPENPIIIETSPTDFELIVPAEKPTPEPQILTIRNSGVGTLNWAITYDCNWIDVQPTSGLSSGQINEVVIRIDANSLEVGKHTCQIVVSDPNATNTPQHVNVSLDIRKPLIGVDPDVLEFSCLAGEANPVAPKLSVWNNDLGTLNWQITEDCNWLKVDPNKGTSTGEVNEVTLILNISGLCLGTYNCALTVSDSNAANSPKTIPVTLHVQGDIVHVPGQFFTIQNAIDNTLEGGTVIVAEGTYTGSGNYNIDFRGKAITVRSTDPNDPDVVANTIIDCNSLGRGFYFHSGEDSNSILAGFTITNGYAPYGGGIYCRYSNPTIANCIITGNKAYGYSGGGGVCSNNSSLTLTNCIITNNLSNIFGGGIYNGWGSAYILNCIISGNAALDSGGGIYNWLTYPTVTNCIIIGNKSGKNGGGMRCWGGDSKITNCTISGNTALNNGGGIYSTYGNKVALVNCILWGNSAKLGRELAVCADNNVLSTASVSFCDLLGGQAEVYIASGCTLNWGNGNVDNDPCFAEPGYWADVNDPNIVVEPNDPNSIWVNGDYHLKSQAGCWDANGVSWVKDDVTSLCIDAGDPNSDWTKELWPNGKRINMGAYGGTPQASMSLNDVGNIADLDLDGFRYYGDMQLFVEKWLYEKVLLPEDLDRNGIVDFFDFAIFADIWEEPPFPGLPNDPNPGDGAIRVSLNPLLSWTAGSDTLQHSIFFGTSVPLVFQGTQSRTTFTPGTLAKDTWHYWRIDEVNPRGVTTGPVWSFKTACPPEPASNPNPANGATNVNINVVLSWTLGVGATSHDVYFGTQSPGTFQRNQTGTTFTPGTLLGAKTYYWRIDEVNSYGKTTGIVWSFKTGGKTICFPGDTLVWLDGAPVRISEVMPGQKITAAGTLGKAKSLGEVESVQEHEGTFKCYDIALENGNCVSVADNHYFLLDSDLWVSVHELTRGSRLQSFNGPIAIESVVKRATPLVGKVYNLKIKDSDRYFVGNDGVIVRDY